MTRAGNTSAANISVSEKEILQFAIDNGILSKEFVQESILMQKKKEILAQHPYQIWEGKNGKWYTYLPINDESKNNRRLVKRTSKESVEKAIIDFYVRPDTMTFEMAYRRWRSVQDETVGDNTVYKYETDYKRFFGNTEFVKMEVSKITEETVKLFIVQKVKDMCLCKQACKTLFGYIRNVFKSCQINHDIKENPCMNLEANHFYKYCTEKKRSQPKTLVVGQDRIDLCKQYHDDYINNPFYIPLYAVELASLTGMRVGELSELRWNSITDKYIIIDKSEKYNRKTKTYYVDSTKNGKERIFPVTTEIKSLLDRVKKAELQCGFISEWVFSNEDGRIHAPIISSCMKNKCRQAGVEERGIHAYRRTVNSMLKADGVSTTVAAALLGHTEEVNDQYYTFDVTGLEEKVKCIEKVNSQMTAV